MDLTAYMTEKKKQHYRSTLRCRLLSLMSQLNSITQLPPPVSGAPNITLNSANGCFWQMHPDSYAFMHLSLKQTFSNAVFFACFHLSPSCESAPSVTSSYIRRKWIWFQPPEPELLHIAHLSPETPSNHPSACLCLSLLITFRETLYRLLLCNTERGSVLAPLLLRSNFKTKMNKKKKNPITLMVIARGASYKLMKNSTCFYDGCTQ